MASRDSLEQPHTSSAGTAGVGGAPGAPPRLQVLGLTHRFGRRTAVDGLSFSADAGEIVGLIGPNGAGKTTTLLCLAGLLRPQAGRILLGGGPVGPERGRRIALIPETPEVYPSLTVWEHLVFAARACRLPTGWEGAAASLLARLELAEQRDTLGLALSKGMRQKTLIAATVLAGAPVLLLDEPMIGLDPRGQRELAAILRQRREAGGTVVLSTHLLSSAEALCDRVVVIKAGRRLAEGPVAVLKAQAGGDPSLEEAFLHLTEAPAP